MSVLDSFAAEIQHFEGWYPGSRSYRNNNPGNIRPGNLSLGQIGVDGGGFAIFPDYNTGYNALVNDIYAKFTGNTRTGLGPGSSVVDFFRVYAPAGDNNNPTQYATAVINGINSDYGSALTIYNTLSDVSSLDEGESPGGVVPVVAQPDGSLTVDNSIVPTDTSISPAIPLLIAAWLIFG